MSRVEPLTGPTGRCDPFSVAAQVQDIHGNPVLDFEGPVTLTPDSPSVEIFLAPSPELTQYVAPVDQGVAVFEGLLYCGTDDEFDMRASTPTIRTCSSLVVPISDAPRAQFAGPLLDSKLCRTAREMQIVSNVIFVHIKQGSLVTPFGETQKHLVRQSLRSVTVSRSDALYNKWLPNNSIRVIADGQQMTLVLEPIMGLAESGPEQFELGPLPADVMQGNAVPVGTSGFTVYPQTSVSLFPSVG
eukprot:gene7936-7348_t